MDERKDQDTPTVERDAYSVMETRQRLGGISQATFYLLKKSKALRTFRIGKRRLVSKRAIEDFIRSREEETEN